jgi:hypothetical protein
MGVGGFLRDAATGIGSVADAFGSVSRERQLREYRDLQAEAERDRIKSERRSEELETRRQQLGLQAEDRLPAQAGKILDVTNRGAESQLGRDTRFQRSTVDNAERLNRAGVKGRIAERGADYEGQGKLYGSQTDADIRKTFAEVGARRGLIGGTLRDVLGQSGGQQLAMTNRFIGDGPGLIPQLTASNERQQRNYLDTVLELRQMDQPQGIAKFAQQLAPVVGMGASILGAFV